MPERLRSPSRKVCSQISPLRRKSGKGIPLQKLLAWMDAYDWDSVEDIPVDEQERRRIRYFNEVIHASGLGLNGSILDLASGATSLAYLYPNAVAVDNNPQKIKMLRKDGIKGVVGNIESLPFEAKSFDYVISISPPLKPRILHKDGYVRFTIDQEYSKKIVEAALRIAKEKVLIASFDIALHPPYKEMIEKRQTNGYY